jgi:hypothetical protein
LLGLWVKSSTHHGDAEEFLRVAEVREKSWSMLEHGSNV